MRNFCLSVLTLFSFLFFLGCSNSPISDPKSKEQHYHELMSQARLFHEQGDSDKALSLLMDQVIKSEDMPFFRELLDAENDIAKITSFSIDNKSIKRDGDYVIVSASIKNISNESLNYIKVKVTYFDQDHNVINTDWTYAVDSVELKSNESRIFEISSKYVDNIKSYSLEVIN